MKKTLVDLFEESVRKYPNNTFLLEKTNKVFEPTTYTEVKEKVYQLGAGLQALGVKKGDNLAGLSEKLAAYGTAKAAAECAVGEITLIDIAKELSKPGRDPRDELPAPILRKDVLEMKDLKPGMVLTGTVRNVIDFGVFVDIGVHQDGLVHISQVCNRKVRHPSEIVQVGDIVKVAVLDVDVERKRISLTMKNIPAEA